MVYIFGNNVTYVMTAMDPKDLLSDDRKLCCILEPYDRCDKCSQEFCDSCLIFDGGHQYDHPMLYCRRCFKKSYGKYLS